MEKKAYVPPHLRNRQPEPAPAASRAPPPAARPASNRSDQPPRPSGGAELRDNGRWSSSDNDSRQFGRGGGREDQSNPWGAEVPVAAADEEPEVDEQTLFATGSSAINFDKYEDIPIEVSGNDIPKSLQSFQDEAVKLCPALLANVKRARYTKPTPVQRHAIPIGLSGRDLMACAQTGATLTMNQPLPVSYPPTTLSLSSISTFSFFGHRIWKNCRFPVPHH